MSVLVGYTPKLAKVKPAFAEAVDMSDQPFHADSKQTSH